MKDCYVTKLKDSVNNSNLEYFEKIKVRFNTPDNDYLQISVNALTSFKLSDATKRFYYDNNPNPADSNEIITSSSLYTQLKDSGDYDLIIYPKYNITTWQTVNYRIATPLDLSTSFEEAQNLTFLWVGGHENQLKGNISALKGKDMTKVVMNSQAIYGDFADAFGDMIHLEEFGLDSSQVTGTIESFVQRQVKAGRTTYTFAAGKVGVLGTIPGITFDGASLPQKASDYISWEINQSDNTKIDVTVSGKTITIDRI